MRAAIRRHLWVLLVLLAIAAPALADERAAARRFEDARRDEPSLIAFLKAMPKGADLHHHFPAGMFAEEAVRALSARKDVFFDPVTGVVSTEDGPGRVAAPRLLTDDNVRYQFLNAASMRGAVTGPAGGHDHFFRTFDFIGKVMPDRDPATRLVEIVRRARLQNIQYLELMANPGSSAMERVRAATLPTDTAGDVLRRLGPQIDEYIAAAKADLDRWEGAVAEALGPGRPVTLRYLRTAFRIEADPRILATWVAAFALMKAEPRMVGVNFAAPEDHPVSQDGFERHMRLLDDAWRQFDRPRVALHAGELNLWLSPVEAMTSRIRRSIELGHARRIGHGVSVAWEDDLPGLLKKMRAEGIAVEICPSSNATILGTEGDRHPFRLYRRGGVPVTINTDDEGISRSNLTLEFVRAVRAWNVSYRELKELVRNSVEYSFLAGESLFEGRDYRRVRPQFRALKARQWVPTAAEERALAGSDTAAVQARLERALVEFER